VRPFAQFRDGLSGVRGVGVSLPKPEPGVHDETLALQRRLRFVQRTG
jgi:hypothetical protein